ncbi:hypothetical protein [Natronosalvus vescus]|uniref:hypothetical protein n=1 Tax=Natronosalvus vescus TaxID=2953881 RepID=UPI0020902222|nr:hypothetical protein [Natronosalvus vescus]
MTYIESPDEIGYYRELFDGIWKSATLRIATIELDDGTQIPSGELVFSSESQKEKSEVRYCESCFTIHEVVTSSPFELLEEIVEGNIQTTDETIELDTEIHSHNTSGYFQTSLEESRVHEDRPVTEINTVVDIPLSEVQENQYSTKRKEVDDLLKRAVEPYYDTGRCQDYYFEYVFAKRADDPKILLFADPRIDYSLADDRLRIVLPEPLVDDFFVSLLPQRPYGQHKGSRIDIDADRLETVDDGRLKFSQHLELDDIEHIYVNLYLDDELLDMIRYTPIDVLQANPRFQILNEYDQRDKMVSYLEGEEPDAFEFAVLNLLSTAGYQVQMYGEGKYNIPNWSHEDSSRGYQEIDIIAYAPDSSEILFVECTNAGISEKQSLLDRSQAIAANALDSVQEYVFEKSESIPIRMLTPCIATPQSPESLNEEVVEDFEEKGVVILHQERLKNIYMASQEIDNTVSIDTEPLELV